MYPVRRDGDCMINIAFRSGSTVSKVHTLCTTFHIPHETLCMSHSYSDIHVELQQLEVKEQT